MIPVLLLALAVWARAADVATPPQSLCKPGGFTVLTFDNGMEARGKADARLDVSFDAFEYQGNDFDAALRAAMSTWSGVSGSRWRYSFAGYTSTSASSRDGAMTVSRGSTSFPAGVLAVTVVSAVASTGQIVDADIFVNPTFSFGPGDYDFESVVLHEMGHGLGLDHNDTCTASRTVMQSTIGRAVQARSLLSPEVEGLRYLYPASSGGGGGGGSGSGVAASPSVLSFSAVAGGAPPPSQSIAISGTTGTPWSAARSGGAWLSVSPAAGTAPALLSVTVSTAGLAAGYYTARATVSSQGTSSDVAVSLNLQPPSVAALELAPGSVAFSAVVGGALPAAQPATLSGSTGLAWTAAASTFNGGGWLRASPSAGTVPGALSISVSTGGLAPGAYQGALTVLGGGLTRTISVQLDLAAQPRLVLEPATLLLSARAASNVPACASIAVTGSGGLPLDWTAASNASWLTVFPSTGRSPTSTSLCATPGSLPPGTYTGAVTFNASASSGPQALTVSFSVTPSVAVNDGGVVNAATFVPGQPVAAGEILSIFGSNLCSTTAAVPGFPLPGEIAGCRALIGGLPARLIYVSPGQMNLVAPEALSAFAGATTTLTAYNDRLATPAVRVSVARQAPGVFTLLGTGRGAAAMTHVDGSVVSRAAPLEAGEAFSVYLTGIGPLDPPVADGAPAAADPLSRATSTVRLLLDGQETTILFAGASPGYAGLHVVVALAPAALARRFPEVVVEVQGAVSNRTTAGGASLLDVSPASVRAGADAEVVLRGIHLASSSAVGIGREILPAAFSAGDLETLRVTIPARLLAAGSLTLAVIDADAPTEHRSNTVLLRVEP